LKWQQSNQRFEKGGLPGTIRSNYGDTSAVRYLETEIIENDLISVGNAYVFNIKTVRGMCHKNLFMLEPSDIGF